MHPDERTARDARPAGQPRHRAGRPPRRRAARRSGSDRLRAGGSGIPHRRRRSRDRSRARCRCCGSRTSEPTNAAGAIALRLRRSGRYGTDAGSGAPNSRTPCAGGYSAGQQRRVRDGGDRRLRIGAGENGRSARKRVERRREPARRSEEPHPIRARRVERDRAGCWACVCACGTRQNNRRNDEDPRAAMRKRMNKRGGPPKRTRPTCYALIPNPEFLHFRTAPLSPTASRAVRPIPSPDCRDRRPASIRSCRRTRCGCWC